MHRWQVVYIRSHQPFWNCELLLVYRLMRRATSFIHTSEIKILFSLLSIIFILIFINVKTFDHANVIFRTSPRTTYMALAGDLVPAGTTLVTPGVDEWNPLASAGMLLRLKLLGRCLHLVQAYGPNSSEQYPEFVKEIGNALPKVKTNESTILFGDLNAHVGHDAGGMEGCDWQTWWCWCK